MGGRIFRIPDHQQENQSQIEEKGDRRKLDDGPFLSLVSRQFSTEDEKEAHEDEGEGVHGNVKAVVIIHHDVVDEYGYRSRRGDGGGKLITAGGENQPADLTVFLQNPHEIADSRSLPIFVDAPVFRDVLLPDGDKGQHRVDGGDKHREGYQNIVEFRVILRTQAIGHVHRIDDDGQKSVPHHVYQDNGAHHAHHVPDDELGPLVGFVGNTGLARFGTGRLGGIPQDVDDVTQDEQGPAESRRTDRADQEEHKDDRESQHDVADDHVGPEFSQLAVRLVYEGSDDRIGDSVENPHARHHRRKDDGQGGHGRRGENAPDETAAQVVSTVVGDEGHQRQVAVSRGVVKGKKNHLVGFRYIDEGR